MTANTWDAKLYDEKHSFVWERAKGVVEMLAPKRGRAHSRPRLRHRAPDRRNCRQRRGVAGIDRSPEMIAQAASGYPDLNLKFAMRGKFRSERIRRRILECRAALDS